MGVVMPDEVQLIATIVGRLSCGQLYGSGSETAHLRAENSLAKDRLPPCCLDAEWGMMKRVLATVSNVCAAFHKHMRRFAEHSHLLYTPMPAMMDIVGC